MKKTFYYLLVLTISCNTKVKDIPVADEYPPEIRNNKFERFYDETKWRLYSIYCDRKCILSELVPIKDTVDYGSLDIKLNKLNILGDTIEISMDFYYNDTIKCDINTVWHFDVLASGMVFNRKSDSVLYFLTKTTATRMSHVDSNNRDRGPVQPEVINYLKNNKEKLHPWFRAEAIRRKIIS